MNEHIHVPAIYMSQQTILELTDGIMSHGMYYETTYRMIINCITKDLQNKVS